MKTPMCKQQAGIWTSVIMGFACTILRCPDGKWRCWLGVPAPGHSWDVFLKNDVPPEIVSSKLHVLRRALDELNESLKWSYSMNLSQNLMSICVAADMLGSQDIHVGDVIEAVINAIDSVDENNDAAVAAAVRQKLDALPDDLEECGADLVNDILGELDRHGLLEV